MKSNTTVPAGTDAHLSKEEYRVLWATSTDAVLIMDEHGTIRYGNPAVLDVFGYAPSELTANNIAVIQPQRLQEGHRPGAAAFSSKRGEETKLAHDRNITRMTKARLFVDAAFLAPGPLGSRVEFGP